ncbi:hypothetical protein KKA00_08320, partial [bacterium]|nr:hypothetical protein [bacterium]
DLNESCPKLSPDKSKVLFRAPSNGVGYPINIYITEIAGLNPQQATFFTEVNQYQTFPVRWGPYSDAVAFTNPDPMVNYPPDPGPFLDIFAVDLNTGIIDTLSNWSGENISSYIADWK